MSKHWNVCLHLFPLYLPIKALSFCFRLSQVICAYLWLHCYDLCDLMCASGRCQCLRVYTEPASLKHALNNKRNKNKRIGPSAADLWGHCVHPTRHHSRVHVFRVAGFVHCSDKIVNQPECSSHDTAASSVLTETKTQSLLSTYLLVCNRIVLKHV